MPLAIYTKAPNPLTPTPQIPDREELESSQPITQPTSKYKKTFFRLLPAIFITLGSILIANVAWPILSYQIFTAPNIQKNEFTAPVSQNSVGNFAPPAALTASSGPNTPQILSKELDYTDPTNWFPSAPFFADQSPAKDYTVSIPKVNIEKAEVRMGGEDLRQSLIQYPGTAMPGQLGAPVIFGHSILRQFYNPDIDNPNRYLSLFSKIMTLDNGDEIYIDYDDIRYTYRVTDKVEVKPEDVFILQQRMNNRELKLITCVPEGTYLRRGIILAQLTDFQ